MKTSFPFDKAGREMQYNEARTWIDEYRKTCAQQTSPIYAEGFSREVLMKLLSDKNCHGVRVYHANQNGEPRLLLVGMDKHGNDMTRTKQGLKDDMPGDGGGSGIYGDGARCPEECGGR